MSKDWNSSLFGCMSECKVCYFSFFYPLGYLCIHIDAYRKATSGGSCTPCCRACFCLCIGCAINRKRIRHECDVKGSFCGDCCTWLFCAPCAASQEYREVKHHKKSIKDHANHS